MRWNPVLVIALSTLVSAACSNDAAQPQPSASTAKSASAAGGPVAACVVGNWTSAGMSVGASASSGEASLTGGGGATVSVSSNGKTDIDFGQMQPAHFAVTRAGTKLAGQFQYSGPASGQIRTGDTTSTSGVWEPIGQADFSGVKITVDLTEPIKVRAFDNVPISSSIAGDSQTGGAIEADPILGRSRYRCDGNNLWLSRDDAIGVTWQLTRKP